MALIKRPGFVVWLFLTAATIVTTWALAKDNFDVTWSTVAIMVIAAVKVRFVLLHFMELKHAPIPLRLVFEAWVVIVTAVVLGFYLVPPAAGA